MIQKQNFYTNEGIVFYVQFWQPVQGMILIILNLQPNFISFNHGKESSSLMKKKRIIPNYTFVLMLRDIV